MLILAAGTVRGYRATSQWLRERVEARMPPRLAGNPGAAMAGRVSSADAARASLDGVPEGGGVAALVVTGATPLS
jgi:hypothetical protein